MKLLLLLIAICFAANAAQSQDMIRLFIVRHADRPPGDVDDLSAAGIARAEELKHVLGLAGIKKIFSTNTIRTKKTAQPLATQLGLPVNIYSSVPAVITLITGNPLIKTNFVVGHSDTVDDLITQCGCTPPANITPSMPTTQFDNLFMVILRKKCNAKGWSCDLTRLRYGVVTP